MDSVMDSTTAATFLHWWFAGTSGPYGISTKGSDTSKIDNASFDSLDQVLARAAQRDATPGHQSVWFRTSPLRQHPGPGERGSEEHASAVLGLFADLDIEDDGHKPGKLRRAVDVNEARSLVAHLPAPSVWVHTGGGLSPWWKFTKPFVISTPADLETMRKLADAWQQAIIVPAAARGIKVDNVRDLARIMRLPGTTNRKLQGVDRPCAVIEGGTGSTYLLDALQGIVEQARSTAPTSGAPVGPGMPVFVEPVAPPPRRRFTPSAGLAELERRAKQFEALVERGNQRHNRLAGLAVEFGRAVAGGFLAVEAARERLMAAAAASGFIEAYGERDATAQVDNGLRDGQGMDPWTLVPELVVTDDDAAGELAQAQKIVIGGHMGLARRYAERYAGTFRYVAGLGWHVWAASCWVEDKLQAPVLAYRHLLDHYAAVATKLADPADPLGSDDPQRALDVSGRLQQMVERNTKVSDVRGVLALAQAEPEITASPDWLNADAYLFATPGGTLDLRTGTVRAPDPGDLITKCAGAGPDPAADAGAWLAFVERVLPDPQVRAFVQRLFGSALVGKQLDHILPVFHGKGANGKGVFQEVMSALFGTYATSLPADALLSRQHDRHRSEWIPLMGARLAFASETEKGRRFNSALVKRLCGGDPITANKMREDPVTWWPTHLLILLTNDIPAVDASDDAMWRRLAIVPFDVVIPEGERDEHLAQRLIAQLPAVAEWVWQGYQEYRRTGLAVPDAVRVRTAAFREDSDLLAEFLAATVEATQQHASVSSSDLFQRWVHWCEQRNAPAGTAVTFARDLEKRGYVKKKTMHGAMWQGLRWVEQATLVEPSR